MGLPRVHQASTRSTRSARLKSNLQTSAYSAPLRLCVKINPHGTIGIMFLIDGRCDFVVLYVRSPELNSVATEVRTGDMKAVG